MESVPDVPIEITAFGRSCEEPVIIVRRNTRVLIDLAVVEAHLKLIQTATVPDPG
jgi:hypothetical protein